MARKNGDNARGLSLLLTLSVRWSNPSTQQTYAERRRVDRGSGKGQTKHGDQSTSKYTNGEKNLLLVHELREPVPARAAFEVLTGELPASAECGEGT